MNADDDPRDDPRAVHYFGALSEHADLTARLSATLRRRYPEHSWWINHVAGPKAAVFAPGADPASEAATRSGRVELELFGRVQGRAQTALAMTAAGATEREALQTLVDQLQAAAEVMP
jgi:hypothetical protein